MDDDAWDKIVDMEGSIYSQGMQDAAKDVEEDGSEARKDGEKAGLLKGYAIGMEVVFMETVAKLMLENDEKATAGRYEKRRKEILEKASQLPNNNSAEIDFDKAVLDLRSLYKNAGSNVGPMIRKANGQAEITSQW